MGTSQFARGHGRRAATRLGLIAGAVVATGIAGAQVAFAATTASILEGPATAVAADETTLPIPDPTDTTTLPAPDPTDTTTLPVPDPTATVTVEPTKPETPGGGGGVPGLPTTAAPPAGSGGGNGKADNSDSGSGNTGGNNVDNNAGGGGGVQLAVTGTDVISIAGVGAAIVAGGVGLVLVSRRRKEAAAEE